MPSTAAGSLMADRHRPSPVRSAISPPAPHTKGYRPYSLPPLTGNGIMSGSRSRSRRAVPRSSSQVAGGVRPCSAKTSER